MSAAVLGNGPLQYQWYFSRDEYRISARFRRHGDTLVLEPALATNRAIITSP